MNLQNHNEITINYLVFPEIIEQILHDVRLLVSLIFFLNIANTKKSMNREGVGEITSWLCARVVSVGVGEMYLSVMRTSCGCGCGWDVPHDYAPKLWVWVSCGVGVGEMYLMIMRAPELWVWVSCGCGCGWDVPQCHAPELWHVGEMYLSVMRLSCGLWVRFTSVSCARVMGVGELRVWVRCISVLCAWVSGVGEMYLSVMYPSCTISWSGQISTEAENIMAPHMAVLRPASYVLGVRAFSLMNLIINQVIDGINWLMNPLSRLVNIVHCALNSDYSLIKP